jgi:HEPN domain-containing protein
MQNRWRDWLHQAEDDYLWARDTLQAGRFAQACFTAQQVGEKALKALALKRGYDQVRSHSIREIAEALEINDELTAIARRLDLYYISARYPDAFPSGAPFQYFTREQAAEAVGFAERIIQTVRQAAGEE